MSAHSSVAAVAARCRLDAGSAAALLAAADGDVETALAIHVGYNGGELLGDGDALGAMAEAEAAKRARPDDAEAARARDFEREGALDVASQGHAAAGEAKTGEEEPLVSARAAAAAAAAGHCFAPVARVNIDGVEGSSIPGGMHLARYGGGDDYRQTDPLLSVWCCGGDGSGGAAGDGAGTGMGKGHAAREASASAGWRAAAAALPGVSAVSLQLLHGFGQEEVLPRGRAPAPAALRLEPHVQLMVSRLPPSAEHQAQANGPAPPSPPGTPQPHVSLMLHGWLFGSYGASGRKAHQKFPLFCLSSPSNLASPPQDGGPQWLPLPLPTTAPGGGCGGGSGDDDGGVAPAEPVAAVGYADQHVHKDEPIDLGGFMFCEVFFGSDMARVAVADGRAPACAWVAAVDVETGRALVTLAVLLPTAATGGGAEAEAETVLDAAVAAAISPADVAAALRVRWAAAAEPVVHELECM